MNTTTHGGKRQGAGRKNVSPDESTKIVTVRLPQSQYEWLAVQQLSAAETIRQLVQKAIEAQRQ